MMNAMQKHMKVMAISGHTGAVYSVSEGAASGAWVASVAAYVGGGSVGLGATWISTVWVASMPFSA